MNFDDIIVKESPGLCRCCLSEGCYKDLGTEYTWMNDTEIYADMLLDCFDIGITQHNDGPNGPKRLICEVCITRLRDACNFKKQVLDSEKRFIDMLGRGEFRPKVVHYQEDLKAETVEELLEDTYTSEVEYLDDIDYVDDVLVKTEDIINSTSQPSTSEDADNGPKPRKGRPRKQDIKPAKPAKIAKVAKDETERTRRGNLKIIFNYTSIIPFKWDETYKCFYCGLSWKDYVHLRKHTESHGQYIDELLEDFRGFRIKVDVSDIACVICETEFKSLELILEHLIDFHSKKYHRNNDLKFLEYRLRDLRCLICDLQFDNFNDLHAHNKVGYCGNKLSRDFNKLIKDLTFVPFPKHFETRKNKSRAEYDRIRKNVQCVVNMSTAVPFKFATKFCCFYCPQLFEECDEMILHTRIEHPVCELKSKAMIACRGERTCTKIDVNDLACKLCLQPMSDLTGFIDHAITEHGANFDKSVPLSDCFQPFQLIQGRIPCPECRQPFASFGNLLKHLGTQHSNYSKALCPHCGRGFSTEANLELHISGSHTGMCECAICSIKCKNPAVLARHMARCHNAKDIKCSQCPEVFDTITNKRRHMINVHNIGHLCAYCGKMFTLNFFMVRHVRRTHLKERTVPCPICNIKFFDRNRLKLHMVVHEGERRFRCEVCGKSFLRMYNLKAHLDRHKKHKKKV